MKHKFNILKLISFIILIGLSVNLNAQDFTSVIFVDNEITANFVDNYDHTAGRGDAAVGSGTYNCYSTVKEAAGNLQAGETMYIRGGRYVESSIYLAWEKGTADAWYTIKSYPEEWAVIDGNHEVDPDAYSPSVFYGTTRGGAMGYIRFENLEITGAGYDIDDPDYPSDIAAGIKLRGGPFVFRYLNIHNNYGSNNHNSAGLMLENGTGNTLVEYCRFNANGNIIEGLSTSVCNLMFFADYKYSSEVVLYSDAGYPTCTQSNEVRYNLFEADAGNGNYTVSGFKHKGMQRLTGYEDADQQNPTDSFPNDDQMENRGDKVHHNIFLDHLVAIEIDQDYAQVYKNIISMKDWGVAIEESTAIQGRDEYSNRRGPFKMTVYNNTIIADGQRAIQLHPVPQGWTGDVPYVKEYLYNNIIENASTGYDWEALSIESDQVIATGGYPLADIELDRNYFYAYNTDDKIIYIQQTRYNKSEIEATVCTDRVYVNAKNSSDPLYEGTTGADQYTTLGAHIVEGTTTIADGGIGGTHPYLTEVSLPSYVGATNSEDNAWVDGVLSLGDNDVLMAGDTTNAIWIEGNGTSTGTESIKAIDNIQIAKIYPNPTSSNTTISFNVTKKGNCKVIVYNLQGQQVKQLFAGKLIEGNHEINWDATNKIGTKVPNGQYIISIRTKEAKKAIKVVVIE